jgi:hypothetical protein
MVFNDSPFTGRIDDPLRMKQKSAVSAGFAIKFDGDSANTHRFKQNVKLRVQHNGLTNEFLVRLGENQRPPEIPEADWQNHENRFIVGNILENYANIEMEQVKAERDRNSAIVSALINKPAAATANGLALASKQHRSWVCQLIVDSCTTEVLQTLEAYEEDHQNDGPTMFFCLLQEYSGATRDAILKAEENLHPSKLSLTNFSHDVKAWSQYARTNLNRITGSGGAITHTHWIHLMSALEESYTERFRLQVIEWNKNWRKQSGEGSNWTILQFLAKADSEYTRLKDLGQWKTQDPNSSIIALQAELQAMRTKFVAMQATASQRQQPTSTDTAPRTGPRIQAGTERRTREKPTFTPATGATNLETTLNGVLWKYCALCERWNQSHTTPGHTGPKPRWAGQRKTPATGATAGQANLASGTPPTPAVVAGTGGTQSAPAPPGPEQQPTMWDF